MAVTVVPTLVKYSDYKAVADLQPTLNLVLDNLSRDREFIVSCLYPIAQHDPFVKGLLLIRRFLLVCFSRVFYHVYCYFKTFGRSVILLFNILPGKFRIWPSNVFEHFFKKNAKYSHFYQFLEAF